MAKAIYTNNAAGQLAGGVGASDTLLLLGAGQGAKFPSPTAGDYFYATLVHAGTGAIEIVKCTARAADTLTVVRGQDSTTAIAFTASSVVECRLVAQGLRDLDWRTVAGLANGVATLDGAQKLLVANLPDVVPQMVGGFIPDGNIAATIARQTAVDTKLTKNAADTMAGILTINRALNADNALGDIALANGTHSLSMRARSTVGTNNPGILASDKVILFHNGVVDAACALFIGPWSSTNKGLRLGHDGSATINGSAIYHAGNFDPATKLNVASPTFTGTGTGTTLNLTGTISEDGGYLDLNAANDRYLRWDSAAAYYKMPGGSGVEAVNFKGTSDRRMKANIVYRNADPFLADKLGMTDFLWKHNGERGTGPIAQDVKRVAPQYVSNTGTNLAVNHAGLALEAVIGLADRVRQLEAKADTTCNSTPSKSNSATSTPRSRSSRAPTSKATKSPRTSK
jgi:hypothetical protein